MEFTFLDKKSKSMKKRIYETEIIRNELWITMKYIQRKL